MQRDKAKEKNASLFRLNQKRKQSSNRHFVIRSIPTSQIDFGFCVRKNSKSVQNVRNPIGLCVRRIDRSTKIAIHQKKTNNRILHKSKESNRLWWRHDANHPKSVCENERVKNKKMRQLIDCDRSIKRTNLFSGQITGNDWTENSGRCSKDGRETSENGRISRWQILMVQMPTGNHETAESDTNGQQNDDHCSVVDHRENEQRTCLNEISFNR